MRSEKEIRDSIEAWDICLNNGRYDKVYVMGHIDALKWVLAELKVN